MGLVQTRLRSLRSPANRGQYLGCRGTIQFSVFLLLIPETLVCRIGISCGSSNVPASSCSKTEQSRASQGEGRKDTATGQTHSRMTKPQRPRSLKSAVAWLRSLWRQSTHVEGKRCGHSSGRDRPPGIILVRGRVTGSQRCHVRRGGARATRRDQGLVSRVQSVASV